jgi:hypothetical protein
MLICLELFKSKNLHGIKHLNSDRVPGYSQNINSETQIIFKIAPELSFDAGGSLMIMFPDEFKFNDDNFSC